MLFARLGIHGWKEADENLLLATQGRAWALLPASVDRLRRPRVESLSCESGNTYLGAEAMRR